MNTRDLEKKVYSVVGEVLYICIGFIHMVNGSIGFSYVFSDFLKAEAIHF